MNEREALQGLYNALRSRHYGRMPEEVQQAYDNAAAVLASAPAATQPKPAAWQHGVDSARVISASQKSQAERDGGASASSVRPYITPLYAATTPQPTAPARAAEATQPAAAEQAHEIWAAAQLAPGEGIEDGVARIAALLGSQAPAGVEAAQQGQEDIAELRRLSSVCPELNLSNYGPDEVDELNGWAIEVALCIDRAFPVAQKSHPQAQLMEIAAWKRTHKKTGVVEFERQRMADTEFNRQRWVEVPLVEAQTAEQPAPTSLVAGILKDCCECERPDRWDVETVELRVSDLTMILERHIEGKE